MIPRSDVMCYMTDESLAPFYRNRRNPPSSSGGSDLRISSRNTSTRNGSKLNNYETRDSSKPELFFTYILIYIPTFVPFIQDALSIDSLIFRLVVKSHNRQNVGISTTSSAILCRSHVQPLLIAVLSSDDLFCMGRHVTPT
ncbi:unnamed protein product [Protopolystoma xenopodis]|uniref:Uncharacterized protein n=1 Tax=Protopolystoma xenopodis TaxID=117903 RepID=A0A3S4ZZD6_9PLAT|nr:unnamed protein product [Protopolystoma xenopodis]